MKRPRSTHGYDRAFNRTMLLAGAFAGCSVIGAGFAVNGWPLTLWVMLAMIAGLFAIAHVVFAVGNYVLWRIHEPKT